MHQVACSTNTMFKIWTSSLDWVKFCRRPSCRFMQAAVGLDRVFTSTCCLKCTSSCPVRRMWEMFDCIFIWVPSGSCCHCHGFPNWIWSCKWVWLRQYSAPEDGTRLSCNRLFWRGVGMDRHGAVGAKGISSINYVSQSARCLLVKFSFVCWTALMWTRYQWDTVLKSVANPRERANWCSVTLPFLCVRGGGKCVHSKGHKQMQTITGVKHPCCRLVQTYFFLIILQFRRSTLVELYCITWSYFHDSICRLRNW